MFPRLLYQTVLAVYGILYLPHFVMRTKQEPDKGRWLRERWGFFRGGFPQGRVAWIHAVSVGEVMVAREFLKAFQASHPDWSVVFSTTTPTGQQLARQLESEKVRVIYFPFDFLGTVNRALDVIRPLLIVLVETEIWPNLIEAATRRGIAIGIVNARMSGRSFKRYRWIRPWLRDLLLKLSFCLVREPQDAERFLELGAPRTSVQITGNMKYDADLSSHPVEIELLRNEWRLGGRPVLIGGSTHDGEERTLLAVFKKLRLEFPKLALILAPRHPERAKSVWRLAEESGWRTAFSNGKPGDHLDVLIINEMGKLVPYFGLSDIVFIGGSLIPHGGQNPIEAAKQRKAILHGPHVSNFDEVYARLNEAGGAVLVRDESLLYEKSVELLSNRDKLRQAGERAQDAVNRLKGATLKNLKLLEPWLVQEK